MGYFKNLEIELQEIHDPKLREIIEWKRAHEHMFTPGQLWDIMIDEVKQDAAIARWRNETNLPAPRRASAHVSLRHVEDENPRISYLRVAGWSLIGVAMLVSVTVLVVAL